MKSDSEILKIVKKQKATSDSMMAKQRSNARENEGFYSGDFMDYRDTVQFSDTRGTKKRAVVQFNRVKPYVNAVKGFMTQNRRKAKYIARLENEQLQELYTQYANSVSDYVRENANAEHAESQQDRDMLVRGVGAIETCMAYGDGYASTDMNGEILYAPLNGEDVYYDPYARKQNLIDGRWCGYSKVYQLDEALELFDGSKADDFDDNPDSDQKQEIKFDARTGANYRILEGYDWADQEEKTVRVAFHQWYEVEKFYRAKNPLFVAQEPMLAQQIAMILDGIEVGDFKEFNSRDEILIFDSKIKAQLDDAFGDAIEIFDLKRKVFYTAIFSGDKLFNKYKSISQQGFSIQFKTGDYDAKAKIWTGMVDSMREPTLYYNKSLTELMFIIAANSKGGVMVERSAVEDIRDFEAKYAKTNSVIVVNDGAISGGQIKAKKEPFSPSGYENIVQLADAAISEVSGINKDFLGSSENGNMTAALQRKIVKQVVSSLACYLDSVTLYQKENARIMLDFLRVFAENNPSALIPIIGEEGKMQFMKLAQDILMAEYGVTIQESPQTPDEKSEHAQLLTVMADKLMAVGDPAAKAIYAVAIKYLPLDKADVRKITEILMPDQGNIDPAYVKQLEDTVKQLQSEGNQAMVAELVSRANLNTAKVDETRAKTQQSAATTAKTLEEADQKGLENDMIKRSGQTQVNVTI